MNTFAPATRESTYARVALAGPPGAGKTWTGLIIATALAGDQPFAVIDTEHRSASKYVGVNGWQFHTSTPTRYAPLDLVQLLGEAAAAEFPVVMIDSFTLYWSGAGGMLDSVDNRTRNNNTFGTGWKEMRPEERQMLDAILAYPGHVIATLRVKTEYVVEENDRGKKEPRKVGLKPDQREGIEYEFDLVADLDQDNRLTVTKSRLDTIPNRHSEARPGLEFATRILDWTRQGDPTVNANDLRAVAIAPDSTAADLVDVGRTMLASGLAKAAVVGADGVTVMTLEDLLRVQYEALSAAPVAPPETPTDIGDGGAPV